MKRLRKYSLQIGAAAILAVVLTLATPRAVHAVAAALVNVTNTAASPAIAQGVNHLASQNVFLVAQVFPGGSFSAIQDFPDGTFSSAAYVVPSGQSLVITSIEVLPSFHAGTYRLNLANAVSGRDREDLTVPEVYTSSFQLPSGIVFPAGESVQVQTDAANPGLILVYLHGYLTAN